MENHITKRTVRGLPNKRLKNGGVSSHDASDFLSLSTELVTSSEKRKSNYFPKRHIKEITECTDNDVISIPWKSREKPMYTRSVIGLHEEIVDFCKYIHPSVEEELMRICVLQKITSIIIGYWPQAKVEVFGSFQTSLYLPMSDIDLVVIGKWPALPLHTIEKLLIDSDFCGMDDIKVIDKARVPIVKVTEPKSGVKVDISFNMVGGIKTAKFIKDALDQFWPLRHIFLVVKQFLLQRELNEVFTGGISSYAIFLLVYNFMQTYPNQSVLRSTSLNLGVLLIEFFELYGFHFNWHTTSIRIKDGGRFVSKQRVRQDFGGNNSYLFGQSMLSIEDPLQEGNDVGKGSYAAQLVQKAFCYAQRVLCAITKPSRVASEVFSQVSSESVLGCLVSISKEVGDYRNRVSTDYKMSKLNLPIRVTRINLADRLLRLIDEVNSSNCGKDAQVINLASSGGEKQVVKTTSCGKDQRNDSLSSASRVASDSMIKSAILEKKSVMSKEEINDDVRMQKNRKHKLPSSRHDSPLSRGIVDNFDLMRSDSLSLNSTDSVKRKQRKQDLVGKK